MITAAHLWAIGYDDMARADQVRDEITELGWGAGQAGELWWCAPRSGRMLDPRTIVSGSSSRPGAS